MIVLTSAFGISVFSSYIAEKSDRALFLREKFLDRERHEHRMRAMHDELTQLPNRALLIDRIEQVILDSRRNNQFCAGFFLDLDNFKEVNDTYGHAVGDAVLNEVSKRLTATIRAADTVARLSGDEFFVLARDVKNKAQAEAFGHKLLRKINKPYQTVSYTHLDVYKRQILSRPVDVGQYGVIYAGAQKNIGPAGLCIVVVREDLLGNASPFTPAVLNWKTQAENQSMINTPPTYSIYIAGLVFEWLLAQGGVEAIEKVNIAKANLLYDAIDSSDFYINNVAVKNRSRMNIPFFLKNESLNDAFLKGAEAQGLMQLKGHRSVGGMRASIYNAMPIDGVQALVAYMKQFENNH